MFGKRLFDSPTVIWLGCVCVGGAGGGGGAVAKGHLYFNNSCRRYRKKRKVRQLVWVLAHTHTHTHTEPPIQNLEQADRDQWTFLGYHDKFVGMTGHLDMLWIYCTIEQENHERPVDLDGVANTEKLELHLFWIQYRTSSSQLCLYTAHRDTGHERVFLFFCFD